MNLFVFGTLKKGLPLHAPTLDGAPYIGNCRPVLPYPMLIADPWFAPMMLLEPGAGHRVRGELYHVDETHLRRIDAVESVGIPGNHPAGTAISNAFCSLQLEYLIGRLLQLFGVIIVSGPKICTGKAHLATDHICFAHPEHITRWRMPQAIAVNLKLVMAYFHVHDAPQHEVRVSAVAAEWIGPSQGVSEASATSFVRIALLRLSPSMLYGRRRCPSCGP
jgi:gamma-glutamylcyclotransferase (GGCT)/AIG2-like uncharacterized protein YtfP